MIFRIPFERLKEESMRRKFFWLTVGLLSLGLAATQHSASGHTPNRPRAAGEPTPQQRMTNAEVIRLMKEHRPAAEIIREIKAAVQSGSAEFDLSPNALIALHGAGVSNDILNAMMGDGSVKTASSAPTNGLRNPGPIGARGFANPTKHAAPGGTNADGLNPQPLPPNSRVQQLLSHARLTKGPVIKSIGTRPALDLNVMQALQQQGNQARTEKLQLPPSIQKTGQNSSPGSSGKLQTAERPMLLGHANSLGQVGPANTMGATTGSSGDPATGAAAPGSATAGRTGGATGAASSSPISNPVFTHAPAPMSACRFNANSPIIETVSGKSKNIYFTPDPGSGPNPNNQYTIRGCNFGASQGQGDVHLVAAFRNNPSPVKLGIDSWSDNLIVVTFDPTFQNEYDLDNVTLVLTSSNGLNVQSPGNHFVATRASRPLARIPNSLVKLPSLYLATDKYVSPATQQNLQLANMPATTLSASILFYVTTALWDSNAGDGYPQQRISFTDVLDFSKLHLGFAVDDTIQTFVAGSPTLSSGDGISVGSGGSCKFSDTVLGANMQGSSMLIGVQPAECDDGGKFIFAYYGLSISVTGPAGDRLDPWQSGLN